MRQTADDACPNFLPAVKDRQGNITRIEQTFSVAPRSAR
jgi:hypothetical protein